MYWLLGHRFKFQKLDVQSLVLIGDCQLFQIDSYDLPAASRALEGRRGLKSLLLFKANRWPLCQLLLNCMLDRFGWRASTLVLCR